MSCLAQSKSRWIFFVVHFFILAGLYGCTKAVSNPMISGTIPGPGKVSAPVSISYITPATVTVGEKAAVTINFTTRTEVDELALTLTGGKGLSLSPAEYRIDYGTQLPASSFSETVTVTPRRKGILYLNIFISGIFNDRKMVRAGAVPLTTGGEVKSSLNKSGKSAKGTTGKKIIIMPAEE